jgi:O-glycosyl hydrolase
MFKYSKSIYKVVLLLITILHAGVTYGDETLILDFETASVPSTVSGWENYSQSGLSASTWSFANPVRNSMDNNTPMCYKITKTSNDPYWTGLEVTFSSAITITSSTRFLHVMVYKNTTSRIGLTYTPVDGSQTSDTWQSNSETGRWIDYILPITTGISLNKIAIKIDDGAGDYYFDQIILSDNPSPRIAAKISIYPLLRKQTIEGWGGSLCWWANVMGGYTDSQVKSICDMITDPINGLNMNIFRFNIGGGDDPTHTHLGYGKNVPGYKVSATSPYNWKQDANQRNILKQLIASRIAKKGVNDIQLVAFSNSPPYWMTISGCSCGHTLNSVCNLKSDMFDDFADYLTEVTKYYHDSLGITFNTIEPFNEPYSWWWKKPDPGATNAQEACYFGQNDQHIMIRELYSKLLAKNMTSYSSISAMDANTIDEGYAGLLKYSEAGDILPKLSRIDVHSYGGTQRKALADLADSLRIKVWQSESCPVWVSGTNNDQIMVMANRIVTDIKELRCPAWIDWQIGAETGATNWGLILANYVNAPHPITKSISFYIRSQFSRFIKQGYTIIDNSHENVLTAISPDEKELVVTVNNIDTFSRKFNIDLSAFSGLGNRLKQVLTLVKDLDGNTVTYPILSGTIFSYNAAPGSVVTFIIPINQKISEINQKSEFKSKGIKQRKK